MNTEKYDANAGAHQHTETRTGPPLDYIAGKLRLTVEALHSVWKSANLLPDDTPLLPGYTQPTEGAQLSTKGDFFMAPISCAFTDALKSYLALNNMLGLCEPEKWMNASAEELKRFLDRVDSEGSVT